MEDTLLKVLNIPIATSGNPLGEYTHINNIIGPAIGVGGTIYNLVTLKSTNFHQIEDLQKCLTFPSRQAGTPWESTLTSTTSSARRLA